MPDSENRRAIEITVSVARFILQEARSFIRHGLAQDLDGADYVPDVPIIDNLASDTDTYRFVDHMLRFVRYVGQLMVVALQAADQEQANNLLGPADSVLDIVMFNDENIDPNEI